MHCERSQLALRAADHDALTSHMEDITLRDDYAAADFGIDLSGDTFGEDPRSSAMPLFSPDGGA